MLSNAARGLAKCKIPGRVKFLLMSIRLSQH
jgi:hypothetical protein